MSHLHRQAVSLALAAMVFVQLAGCGYIFHPSRRGQTGGRIDAGIAVMDGLGLLLFLVPGIIAFAVDFSTGCIYLPGTGRGALDVHDMKTVLFDVEGMTAERLQEIIRLHTGVDVRMDDPQARGVRLKSLDELSWRQAMAAPAPIARGG